MLALLRQQNNNLKSLLKTIIGKRNAIVANNITEIERLTSDEEKILREINQTEKLRLDSLAKYIMSDSERSDEISIDDYISMISYTLNNQQQKEFSDLRSEIKDTTNQIMQINHQIKYVILQSKSLLDEIVSAIFKDKNNSLLDVKI